MALSQDHRTILIMVKNSQSFLVLLYQYSKSLQEFATECQGLGVEKANQAKNVNFYWKSFLFYDKIGE